MKIWVDGSSINNPGPGGWGVVMEDGKELSGGVSHATNNQMELKAIEEGIKNGEGDLTIYTDSLWCVNAITGKWNITRNIDIVQKIQKMMKERKGTTTLVWVRGHSGNEGNYKADRLAQRAARDIQKLNGG